MIGLETAELVSTAKAVVVKSREEAQSLLNRVGEHLGLSFTLCDDALIASSEARHAGAVVALRLLDGHWSCVIRSGDGWVYIDDSEQFTSDAAEDVSAMLEGALGKGHAFFACSRAIEE